MGYKSPGSGPVESASGSLFNGLSLMSCQVEDGWRAPSPSTAEAPPPGCVLRSSLRGLQVPTALGQCMGGRQ